VLHRIRRNLSFANVMSVIAVFVALGGSAYAAKKLSGKQLKNNSVAAKKLVCPTSAPTRTGDLCYSSSRGPADWISAVQAVCPSLGLRLPTNGEALLVAAAAGGETWSDDVITPSAAGDAGRVQNGIVFSTPLAQPHAFRCVANAA
jgi:hypothetical protein